MKLIKNKIYMYLFSIILIIAIVFLVVHIRTPKCPDDFPNDDAGFAEQLKAFENWSHDFYAKYPHASISEWGGARLQFYKDNNCMEAIKRYQEQKMETSSPDRYKIVQDFINKIVKGK